MSERPTGRGSARTFVATTGGVAAIVITSAVTSNSLPAVRPLVPIVLTVTITAALVASYLLVSMAGIQRRSDLTWLAAANLVAAVAMTVQIAAFAQIAPGGGLLRTSASGSAALYLLWHLAMVAAIGAGVFGVTRHLALPFTVLCSVAAVASGWNDVVELPELVTADLEYTPLLQGCSAVLTVLAIGSVVAWARHIGPNPLAAQGWVAASITCGAADVALFTFAEERYSVIWWGALGARSAGFVVLAVGLLVHVTRLHGQLDRYTDVAEERHRRSETDAATDFLTGVLNRRGFEEAARRALSVRPGAAVLVFVDLDGFKAINDTSGHDAGDEVLRRVGDAISGVTRARDVAGRWGGDEFVVLLPDTPAAAADGARRRIADAVASVTEASVGAHVFVATDGDDLDRAVAEADGAMYETKRAGR